MKCPKCEGEMEEGYTDLIGSLKKLSGMVWFKEKRWVENPKERIEVKSYRCKSCGFLESYAK